MDEKDQIKQRVDMVELVSEYVKLSKAGSNYKGLCPFHNEKTPSFFVHSELGIFKCFGCGESGDCYEWLMKMDHLTFPEALQELSKRTGIKLTKFKPDPQARSREQILQSLSFAREFYHWLLTQHQVGKPALQYIKQRGIKTQAIKTFKLGWSPNDWDALQRYLTKKKNFPIPILIKAGLMVPKSNRGSGYDRFRGRLMFPLQNVRGQTLGFAGRIIEGVTQGPKDVGKYINTPETEVYHKRQLLYALEVTKPDIKKAQQVVVVEGELDAISSWQAGVKQVVAIKGSALTEEQVTILKRYTDTIILALDTDLAGDKAARQGIRTAEAAGLEVKVVKLSGGKDPDEVARSDPQAWKHQVNKAIDVYQFLLESALHRHGTQTATAKRKMAYELLPIWAEITSHIVQAHWVAKLALQLDVKEDTIWQEMAKVNQPRRTQAGSKTKSSTPNSTTTQSRLGQIQDEPIKELKKSRHQQLQELLVAHYLKTDLTALLNPQIQSYFHLTWIKRLFKFLESIYKSKQKLPDTIFKLRDQHQLPQELESNIAQVVLLDDLQSTGTFVPQAIINHLQEIKLKQKLHTLRQQISQLEQQGKESKLLQVQKEFSQISSHLAKLKQNKV